MTSGGTCCSSGRGAYLLYTFTFLIFLLLYFLGGNAADDPLLREVAEQEEKKKEEESNSSRRSHSDFGRNVAEKFAKKPPVEEPLQGRKERKAINRGVNAKR